MFDKKGFIALGSNLGNRSEQLRHALWELERINIQITSLSSIYESPAMGFVGAPFYNACLQFNTNLPPQELLQSLLNIEQKMGRNRSESRGYQARVIDLDILFYENEVIDSKNLKIPHPEIEFRDFVLHPLAEIAPNFVHPHLGKTILELKLKQTDGGKINKLEYNLWTPPVFKTFQNIVVERK